jgi:hypothetical protein
MMEALSSSGTSVITRVARRNSPEETIHRSFVPYCGRFVRVEVLKYKYKLKDVSEEINASVFRVNHVKRVELCNYSPLGFFFLYSLPSTAFVSSSWLEFSCTSEVTPYAI